LLDLASAVLAVVLYSLVDFASALQTVFFYSLFDLASAVIAVVLYSLTLGESHLFLFTITNISIFI